MIAAHWAPQELKAYAEKGGRVLIVSARPPSFSVVDVIRTIEDIKGYVRVRNHKSYPALTDTDLLMLNGPFTEVHGDGTDSLTLVPPSMIGPPGEDTYRYEGHNDSGHRLQACRSRGSHLDPVGTRFALLSA